MENNETTSLGLYAEESQKPYFFLRLFRYYYLYTTAEERAAQQDTDIIFVTFDDGRFSIRYADLKVKADADAALLRGTNINELYGKNNYDLKLPPLRKV